MSEILGPGASKIKVIEPVADATGFPGDDTPEPASGPAEAAVLESAAPPPAEKTIDPFFPFGTPNDIDWNTIDKAGAELIQEINLRPWIKSVEYCSGHPLDRPPDEESGLYPYVSGENVYDEISKLDMAFVRGLIPDVYFRYRKQELRTQGMTRFYLNVNVYNIEIFLEWTKAISHLVTIMTQSAINPVVVRYNPLRPGVNYSIYWDYWTMDERDMIHDAVSTALNHIPI